MVVRQIGKVLELIIIIAIITVLAHCGGGGGGGASSEEADTAAPQIISTGPGDEAGINEPITVTFSEPIDRSSLASNTIQVSGGVTGSTSYNSDSKTVIFTPSANLLPLETYSITVNPGIKDLAGNVITGTYVTQYITGGGITAGSWTPIDQDIEYIHGLQTAVWTGSEVIIWGGFSYGARYNPTTDSLASLDMSAANYPSGRKGHSAVWTGSKMIIWGGTDQTYLFNSGFIYNPAANTWNPTSTVYAPSPRRGHFAVWTGSEMIVWGGWDGADYLNTGGRYNPTTNAWIQLSTVNAPAARETMGCNDLSCYSKIAMDGIWTGSEMIVWGGWDGVHMVNTGGRYNPSTGVWTPMSTVNAPPSGKQYSAVWTGSEMIVWGGDTGARYSPSTDTWQAMSTSNAPSGGNAPVWNGSVMILWGAGTGNRTGGIYNPSTDSWTGTSVGKAPLCGGRHFAFWNGSEMVVLRSPGMTWLDGRYWSVTGGGGKFRP